jgi:hypothetical protein
LDRTARQAVGGWTVFVAALGACAFAGCRADLGRCDFDLAWRVTFKQDGSPAYEGQALVETSCAASFCHTPDATGAERQGVPAGLDFDVSVACGSRGTCSQDALSRLQQNQRNMMSWAGRSLHLVERGAMPPGGAGDAVVRSATQAFAYADLGGTPLPSVDSAGGREILRNWLACGAPVVERTKSEGAPGSLCNTGAERVGDCIVERPCPLEPTWASIYECIIATECATCHSASQPTYFEDSKLDLSTAALAYAGLVGVEAAGEECAGMGTLVVPGDADASLLIDKMGADPSCGDPMPLPPASLIPQDRVDVIRAWIEAGAPEG